MIFIKVWTKVIFKGSGRNDTVITYPSIRCNSVRATKPRNEGDKNPSKAQSDRVRSFVVRLGNTRLLIEISRACNHAFLRALFFLNIPVIISDANLFIGRVYFAQLSLWLVRCFHALMLRCFLQQARLRNTDASFREINASIRATHFFPSFSFFHCASFQTSCISAIDDRTTSTTVLDPTKIIKSRRPIRSIARSLDRS